MILTLSVPLKMLLNSNSFPNQMVEILEKIRSKSYGLENSQDFIAHGKAYLCKTMGITQDDTDS